MFINGLAPRRRVRFNALHVRDGDFNHRSKCLHYEGGVLCNHLNRPLGALLVLYPAWPSSESSVPRLLRTELIVAVTVFAVLVPSAMAYGELAGVTPVAGLYARSAPW